MTHANDDGESGQRIGVFSPDRASAIRYLLTNSPVHVTGEADREDVHYLPVHPSAEAWLRGDPAPMNRHDRRRAEKLARRRC